MMNRTFRSLCFAGMAAVWPLFSALAAGDGRVVTTIKPLHSLVAGVMLGDGAPELLVDGASSEHDFSLRPSQMEMLQDADIVFYIGDDLEIFLAESLSAIPQEVRVVSMQKAAALELLPTRKAIRGDEPQQEQDEAADAGEGGISPRGRSGQWSGGIGTTGANAGGWSSASGGAPIAPSSATAQLAQQWQDKQRNRYTQPGHVSSSASSSSGGGGSIASRNAQWLEQAARGNYTGGSSTFTPPTIPKTQQAANSRNNQNSHLPTRNSFKANSSISERQQAYKESGGYPVFAEDGTALEKGAHDDHEGHDHGDHDGHAPAEHGAGKNGRHEEHSHGRYDLHVWLNPENAKRMTDAIAEALAKRYPEKAPLYTRNAADVKARIDAQWRQLHGYLTPFANRPFITFHDAYQYFEKNYGLDSVGSISLHPGQAPGARRMAKLRDAMREHQVRCVFAEPQYDDSVIASLTEGLTVKVGQLDPLGADLKNGPDLYFDLNARLAAQFAECLG